MPKINNNNEFSHVIELINQKLSFITINSESINLLKTDKKFDEIFSNLLATLIVLEEKTKKDDKKSTNLIEAYKTITNNEFNGKSLEFNDADDVEDQLNYIDIYLKNTLGDEIIEDIEKNNVQEPKEEVVEATKIIGGEEVHNFNNNANKGFDAEEYLRHNNVTLDQMAEQMVNQQAQLLLRRDIMENKVYKFDSKPKIVFFLKLLNNVVFLLLACACLVFAIMSFTNTYVSKIVEDGSEKFYFISGGPSANVFEIIGIVLLVLFAGVQLFNEIKYYKNDNFKYNIKLFYIFFLAIIFIWFILDYINFLKLYQNANGLINNSFKIENNALKDATTTGDGKYKNTLESFDILKVQFGFVIANLSLFGSLMINSLVLTIIKPRVDVERLQKIVLQYVQDIKNGKINPDNLGGFKTSNPFGGLFF